MYSKIFSQIYDGTLCTRGPWQALVTFQQLLVLADQEGTVDMTAEAISRRTTIPLEIIQLGIEELLKPDPQSRTPTEDGRRIVPLSEGRVWGWRVVNYRHYRQLKRENDRRDYHREYWHKRKQKQDDGQETQQNTQQPQPNQPIAEAYAEADKSNLPVAPAPPADERQDPASKVPDCPHQEVLALWAEVLPAMPQHLPSQWKGSRADHLRARWRETAVEKKWVTTDQGLTYFRKLFAYVGQSEFLTGRSKPHQGKRPFIIELEWLVSPKNWAKVHEGKYHGDSA